MEINERLAEEIMDELYFVCSYAELRMRLTDEIQIQIDEALLTLCERGMVDPFGFENGDFVRIERISKHQLQTSSFLNTKKGLLWLHGMDKSA